MRSSRHRFSLNTTNSIRGKVHMRSVRGLNKQAFGVSAIVGGVLSLAAGVDLESLRFLFVGGVATVVGGQLILCSHLTELISAVHGPSRAMFDRGREMGYQAGWREGHRSARPVVVPMPLTDSSEPHPSFISR